MYNNWKELKDTLLDLYRRCSEHDIKYRIYLESVGSLYSLENYRNSFSDRKPASYIVLEHIKDLSEDGKDEYDRHILYYLLHIDSILDRIPIVHRMLSIIDTEYDKKEESLRNSINAYCENKNDPELFKRMMLDYNNLINDKVYWFLRRISNVRT